MLDQAERHEWFMAYLAAGMDHARAGHCGRVEAIAWARSMSLIAEQFVDDDDRELVDG